MKLSDLSYEYPDHLIATSPREAYRILFKSARQEPEELTPQELFMKFQPGDLLVINDTKVEKRRIFSGELEIVFVEALSSERWSVLFPAKKLKIGDELPLPGGVTARLLEKGLPQILETSKTLDHDYFNEYAEPALPPYIQKARGERHAQSDDEKWYQTEWAAHLGSVAAPTASLHFSAADFERLKARGVWVVPLTLHVGLGTFLPVKTQNLDEHKMHAEKVLISQELVQALRETKARGSKVWALGTTACRALESWALESWALEAEADGPFQAETRLFIKPGFEFKVVDVLLTNFHQPESTLLALVSGFAGLENVKATYRWAIEKEFRLFSYGDLSVWTK